MFHSLFRKDGYLFDKEVILQYIITKKNEYHRKLKEYERLKKNEEEELLEKASEETQERIKNFLKAENNIVSKPVKAFASDEPSTSTSVSNMANGKDKELPSFWVPSQTPDVKKNTLLKPESTIYCPVSGKPLKAKDLINVKFTPIDSKADKKSLITKESRYMCPVTRDALSNSVPCAVLKPT